jgi:hypothetical protein
MARQPRRPARSSAARPADAPVRQPARLFPADASTVADYAVRRPARRGGKGITVEVPFQRFQLLPDEDVHPLAVTVRRRDLGAWTDALAENPLGLGFRLLHEWNESLRPDLAPAPGAALPPAGATR